MSFNKPKISIVSGSYNHEKYVGRFIESILNQTFEDFELIIIDDKSTDNTLKKIESCKDKRIKIIKHSFNCGPSITVNDGIKKAKGEYIAFMSTDDEVYPPYLEEGIKFLEKNKKYNATCFQLEGIDENSNYLQDNDLQRVLKFRNLNHYKLIKNMFNTGNMLPAPGEIIRKSIIKKIGDFNPALLQTQDYDFHIRTILKNKVYVYQKPLVKYRQFTNGTNVDNHTPASKLRHDLELPFVLDSFLKIDLDLFKKVFKKEIKKLGKPTQNTIPYFLGSIAVDTQDSIRQKWGYQTIIDFISKKNHINILNNLYKKEFKDLINLNKNI